MMRSSFVSLLFGVLFVATMTVSQTPPITPNVQLYAPTLIDRSPVESDDEKDPAYKIYKEGYSLILDEKWAEAMKKLAEVKTKNSKSEYLDDAAYWSAYAQKRLDKKKGLAAYELFIETYPESSYLDDAVSDMSDGDVSVIVSGNAKNLRIRTPRPGSYSYSIGSTARESEQAMREVERAMRDANREMRRAGVRIAHAPTPSMAGGGLFGESDDEKKLDKKTRMKLAALRALSNDEDDKEAFQTLKEVALDKSQPMILRRTAVESVGEFQKFDAATVLIDVAKNDPDEYVRMAAINGIGDASRDKNKAVDNLLVLWSGTPKGREKQLETLLYVIADVGNDKAVDFLVKVAHTHENDDLRSDAVYYLGNIGNPKSRAALLQILKSK